MVLLTSIHGCWKNHSFDFIRKVMSLLFNMLCTLVIAFIPRSKHLNFIDPLIVSSDFVAQENKICHCFTFYPFVCREVMRLDAIILVFRMLCFKPTFSLSSFTFIKRIFSSSLFPAIRVVSSAYLNLFMFRLAVLVLACDSSTLSFLMMYVA